MMDPKERDDKSKRHRPEKKDNFNKLKKDKDFGRESYVRKDKEIDNKKHK